MKTATTTMTTTVAAVATTKNKIKANKKRTDYEMCATRSYLNVWRMGKFSSFLLFHRERKKMAVTVRKTVEQKTNKKITKYECWKTIYSRFTSCLRRKHFEQMQNVSRSFLSFWNAENRMPLVYGFHIYFFDMFALTPPPFCWLCVFLIFYPIDFSGKFSNDVCTYFVCMPPQRP